MKAVRADKNAICSRVVCRLEQRLLGVSMVDVGFDLEPRSIKFTGVFFNHSARRFPGLPVMVAHPLLCVTAGPGDGAFQPVVDAYKSYVTQRLSTTTKGWKAYRTYRLRA